MTTLQSAHELSNHLADQAADTAESAIRATQRVANQALDGMAESVSDLRAETASLTRAGTEQASAMAQRASDAMRQASQQLVSSAQQATTRTRDYVQQEPVKALLIAAATGAALMALLSLVRHQRNAD